MRENILPQWKLQWPASSDAPPPASDAESAAASGCACDCDAESLDDAAMSRE